MQGFFIVSFLVPTPGLDYRQSRSMKAKDPHMSLGQDSEGSQEVHTEKFVGLE